MGRAKRNPPLARVMGFAALYPSYALEPVTVEETDHYRVMREFCADPASFVEAAIEE